MCPLCLRATMNPFTRTTCSSNSGRLRWRRSRFTSSSRPVVLSALLAMVVLALVAQISTTVAAPAVPRHFQKTSKELYAARVRALTAKVAAGQGAHRPMFKFGPGSSVGGPKMRSRINLAAAATAAQQPAGTVAKNTGTSSSSSNSTAGGHVTLSREKVIQNLLKATVVDSRDFLGVKKLTLPNGITLLHLRETSAPTVSVVFSYHVGSRNEEEENQGVAHLLEHMMFKGTAKRPVQWGRLYYVLGDQTNAYTTYGNTAYFHTVHKTAVSGILELEKDRMKNLELNEKQLKKEKNVVMSELTASRNDALMRLNEEVMRAAYPNDWPGRSIGGKTVMSLTREDANHFYSKAYRPGCLTVSVVGDIEWETLVREMENVGLVSMGTDNLNEFAKCDFNVPRPVAVTETPSFDPAASMANKVLMKEEDAKMSVLEYVVPLCNMSNIQDVAALRVVEVLLNSVMGDLLNSVGVPVAEGGAMVNFEEDAGWMVVAAALGPGGSFADLVSADDALSGVGGLFEMFAADGPDSASNPLDPTVVAQVVAQVVEATRQEWFSDVSSLAVHLAVDQTLQGDHLYTQRLLNATKAVTVEDVVRVFKLYFAKERLVVGTYSAGTAEEAAETMKLYGGVDKYTDHESVNNSASFFKSLQCDIPPADVILSHVAELPYRGEASADKDHYMRTGVSLPVVPPLCFEDTCDNPKSYRPPRPIYLRLKNGMELLAHEDVSFGSVEQSVIMGHIDAGMEYDPTGFEGTSLMLSLLLQLNVEMYVSSALIAAANASAMSGSPQDQPQSVPQVVLAPQVEGILISGEVDCGSVDLALEALHHALTDAVPLTASEHQQMQGLVGDMVEAAKEDPGYIMKQMLLSEIYPDDHPLVRSPTAESIQRIPLELVNKLYVNRICPEHVRLSVVSGRLGASPVAAINKMADLFERWPSCSSPLRQRVPQAADTAASPPPGTPGAGGASASASASVAAAAVGSPMAMAGSLSDITHGKTRGAKAALELFQESPLQQSIAQGVSDALARARGGSSVLHGAAGRLNPLQALASGEGMGGGAGGGMGVPGPGLRLPGPGGAVGSGLGAQAVGVAPQQRLPRMADFAIAAIEEDEGAGGAAGLGVRGGEVAEMSGLESALGGGTTLPATAAEGQIGTKMASQTPAWAPTPLVDGAPQLPQEQGVSEQPLPRASLPPRQAGETVSELRAKLEAVLAGSRVRTQLNKVITSGSEFLDHVFGDGAPRGGLRSAASSSSLASVAAVAAAANGEDGDGDKPFTMASLFPTLEGGRASGSGGFGFLAQLSGFRRLLNEQLSSAGGRNSGGGSALAGRGSGGGGLKSRLRSGVPGFMQTLRQRSLGTNNQGAGHSREENIPGLDKGSTTLSGMGELGSLLALSWADVTQAIRRSRTTSGSGGGLGGGGGAGPGNMDGGAVGGRPALELSGAMDRIKSLMLKPTSGRGVGVAASVQDKMAAGLSREMNMVRGIMDRAMQRAPPSVQKVYAGIKVPHLTSGLSFSDFNSQLREALGELEAKMPEAGSVGSEGLQQDLANVAMQLESLRPQLRKIGHLPLRLLGDDDTDGQGGGGGSGGSGGTLSLGSNLAPEPVTGGVLGLVQLPPIPDTPRYPPPKDRSGVIWIKMKVPGLHEVMTTMMSDSLVHSNPNLVPAMVGNHILGGNSLAGKLGYWVRDCKGLTYHVSSSLDVSRRAGLFEVSMQTQGGAALDQAVNDTLNIIQGIQRKGFSGAELAAAQRNLLATASINAASSGLAVCEAIMMDTVYASDTVNGIEDGNLWTSRSQQILDMELKELNRTAAGVFNPARLVIISLGQDLEDTRLPNPNSTMEDYLPVPDDDDIAPPGARGAARAVNGTEEGGCPDMPEGEAANPYRVGSVATYTPPSKAMLVQQQHLKEQQHQMQERRRGVVGGFADETLGRAGASLLGGAGRQPTVAIPTDTLLAASSARGGTTAGPFGAEVPLDPLVAAQNEQLRLQRNLVTLERVGERYVDAVTGGALTKSNNALRDVKRMGMNFVVQGNQVLQNLLPPE